MSSLEINKLDNEEENKTPDKKQIEAEEKEVMLKSEAPEGDNIEEAAAVKVDEGPVKAALSAGDVTEQGREVKPKFIPIGAIKMPGFFTRNSDKEKSKEEDAKEDDTEKTDEPKPKRHRLQFLHTCPFTQFMHHPQREEEKKESEEQTTDRKRTFTLGKYNVPVPSMPNINMPNINMPNIQLSKILKRGANKDPEAALASMETLEDKLDAPNDGMENVKLDTPAEKEADDEGKVQTKLPLKERIRQKKFIIDDIVVCAVVAVVLLAMIVGIAIGARAGPPAERPLRLGRYMTTLTSCGPVEGVLDQGVYNYYGIPYAVPPVGDKRFTNAQPLKNISMCWNGTLQAHNRTALCLQFLGNGSIAGQEDCLTLDVVTPHVRYDSPLPVVVLIGANSLAGGISPAQPSPLYARTKEVVFVRPNFRLGPFGFLALDILSNTKYPPTSGNYALTDLLAALEWVKYNIEHFGGDPRSVTLLGHRAGATLTAALTTMKKAQKLYSRVWLSSPSVALPTEPLLTAERNNELFKQVSKCNVAACLRRKSAIEILSITPDIWMTNNYRSLPLKDEFRRSWLVLDGDLLRVPANESWIEQKKAKESGKDKVFKPIVMGTTQHSAHSDILKLKYLNWTSVLVEQAVNESLIGQVLGGSAFTHFNKTYEGMVEMISAVRTLCPLMNLTQSVLGAPLYVVLGAGAGGGASGSGIAPINADIEAILGTFDSEMAEQRRFMSAMQLLFYYYVWHGQLPGPQTGLIAVGQDLLPLTDLPACRMLIEKGLVPQYAHVD